MVGPDSKRGRILARFEKMSSEMREDPRLIEFASELDQELLLRMRDGLVEVAHAFWALERISIERRRRLLDDVTVQAYLLLQWGRCEHFLHNVFYQLAQADFKRAIDPYAPRLFEVSLLGVWEADFLVQEQNLMATIGIPEAGQDELVSRAERGKNSLGLLWEIIPDFHRFPNLFTSVVRRLGKYGLLLPLFQIALAGAAIGGDAYFIASEGLDCGSFISIITGLGWLWDWMEEGRKRIDQEAEPSSTQSGEC